MKTEDTVMVIEKPYMVVKLHPRLLEVDFAAGLRKELENVLEAKPGLRDTLGFIFQSVIPLDVPLKDIDSASVNEEGQVRIEIPLRRDLVIPLKMAESRRLVEKLNQLIPIEKERALRELEESERRRRELEAKTAEARTEAYRRTVTRTRMPS